MGFKSMTFNGIRKPHIILLEGRHKPPFASRRHQIKTMRYGAKLRKTTVDPLPIQQPIGFVVESNYDAMRIRDELTNWLITDEPAPLEFDDEPGRTYYALVENSIDDFSRFAYLRQGTLQFICLDPFAHGDNKILDLSSTIKEFNITGQAVTPWDINVAFKDRASKFEVAANNGLFLQLNFEFVAGDRLSISYVGRKVTLNGQDLRRAVSMNSNFVELQPGPLSIRASHGSTLKYDERFY